MAVDPVCHMNVEEHKAAATYEYKGVHYYFCSAGCKAAFEKDPEGGLLPRMLGRLQTRIRELF